MRALLLAAALILTPLAGSAAAQIVVAPTRPPVITRYNPADEAPARAEADRLIRRAKAEEVFVNVTRSDRAVVRHRGSGMLCVFVVGNRTNRIQVLDNDSAMRGNDVACRETFGEDSYVLRATRVTTSMNGEMAYSRAVADLQRTFRSAQPYQGDVWPLDHTPRARTWAARFIAGPERDPHHFKQILVAEIGGWVYQMQVSAPGDPGLSQFGASATWDTMMKNAPGDGHQN